MTLNYIDLLGKPHKLGAHGPEAYDCYHLCVEVLHRVGKEIPKYTVPDETVDIHELIEAEKLIVAEQIEKPEPYCIVTFCVIPGYVTHCGVVLENCKSFIHVMRKISVAVERLDLIPWRNKIRGFYRMKDK